MMRLRPDGYLEATSFEEHMAPGLHWIDNEDFAAEFAALTEEDRMTTAITVDAHAGWPVTVVTAYGEPGETKSYTTHLVEPMTTRVFHLHSGMRIVTIEEMPKPAQQFPYSERAQPDETHGDGA